MAYESGEKFDKIICDKCGKEETASGEDRGKKIFDLRWTANFNARKYVHICYGCQTGKQKKTTDWAVRKFKNYE